MSAVRLFAASAVLLLALAAPTASAVRHNRISSSAVGPLRLGMDPAAAKKALRSLRPGTLRGVERQDVKGGLVYLEYSYYRGLGDDSYAVGFLGPKGKPRHLRVARLVTFVAGDRTGRGAHVGMSENAVARMYGAMTCGQTIIRRVVDYKACRVGAASKQHIVFLFSKYFTDPVLTVNRIAPEQAGLKISIVPKS
jgi:hypothetical protein